MDKSVGIQRELVLNDKDSAASSGLRSTTTWKGPHAGAKPMLPCTNHSLPAHMAFIAFLGFFAATIAFGIYKRIHDPAIGIL